MFTFFLLPGAPVSPDQQFGLASGGLADELAWLRRYETEGREPGRGKSWSGALQGEGGRSLQPRPKTDPGGTRCSSLLARLWIADNAAFWVSCRLCCHFRVAGLQFPSLDGRGCCDASTNRPDTERSKHGFTGWVSDSTVVKKKYKRNKTYYIQHINNNFSLK